MLNYLLISQAYAPAFFGYIGKMEKKMEIPLVYWGYIGIMEKKMETPLVGGCIGMLEKNMEAPLVYWVYICAGEQGKGWADFVKADLKLSVTTMGY